MTEPIPSQESVTSISSQQLSAWLKDLDRHGDELLSAVQNGRAKVTTASGFAQIASQLRHFSRAYADEALKVSELTSQKVVLSNALFYFLKAFEGIALRADQIDALLSALPLQEGLDVRRLIMTFMDAQKRDLILQNGKGVAEGFDASWIARIDVAALGAVLRELDLDFEPWQKLAAVLSERFVANPVKPLEHGQTKR